jgi:integrase
VYLGARAGELNALRVRDIDRQRWVVNIAEAMTTRGSPLRAARRAPKTQAGTRSFSAEASVRPLLELLCTEGRDPHARLLRPFRTDGPDGATSYLQRHLRVAGVQREELFATTVTRKRITFHDLRATFCTWCAIRGDEPMRIMHRAGHEDLVTTMGYVRAAEVLDRDEVGEVFPPLPATLLRGLDLGKDQTSVGSTKTPLFLGRYVASPEGFEPSLAT